jgi:uncharacterized protein
MPPHSDLPALTDVLTQALDELCRRYRVAQLDLFGSAADGTFDPEHSDVDLMVTFDEMPAAEYADCYFGLLESLECLFGRPVDLVTARSIRNPYFRESVERTRRRLYAA